ncbi:MAG: hypothetical protein ACFFAU_12355 [Candidatus Hodarchaeota archaeon]
MERFVRYFKWGITIFIGVIIYDFFLVLLNFPTFFGLSPDSIEIIALTIVFNSIGFISGLIAIYSFFKKDDSIKKLSGDSEKQIRILENLEKEVQRIPNQISIQISQNISEEYLSLFNFDEFSDLDSNEVEIFKAICKGAIERDRENVIGLKMIEDDLQELFINSDKMIDILETLEYFGLIEIRGALGMRISTISITTYGLEVYASQFFKKYKQSKASIIDIILTGKSNLSNLISESLNIPHLIVRHVLEILEQENYIKTITRGSGRVMVSYISPVLKRKFKKDNI